MIEECALTVVVTAHAEGALLHPTLRSVRLAAEHAVAEGVEVEVLLVLDRPTPATVDFVEQHATDLRVEHVDFGDPAAARNHGVSLASSEFIALLDGDDLFGQHWLVRAVEAARGIKGPFVLHPECVVCFGAESLVAYPVDSRTPRFRPKALLRGNLWNSVHVVTRRELLQRVPFVETPADSGLGFEDWHWHAEIASMGIQHRTVPHTAVFYRRKGKGSRFADHTQAETLLPPSSLLRPAVFPFLGEPLMEA